MQSDDKLDIQPFGKNQAINNQSFETEVDVNN